MISFGRIIRRDHRTGLSGGVMAVMAIAAGVLMFSAAAQASPRTLAFYPLQHVETPPVVDGDLSDAAWKNAPEAVDYYVYWKPDPDFGALRTRMKMIWSDQGIYLAVSNEDDNPAGIRATIATRDDSKLWTDDCNEIYFDPAGTSIGYTRFVVNPLGTQQDDRRIDAAVVLSEWSGVGWIAKTRITDKGWTLEAFFPWGDLNGQARGGDLWRYNHVRYGYSSGKFQGVTWAPGGNYASTDKFGYLYFVPRGQRQGPDVKTVAGLLEKSATPPWQLLVGEGLLVRQAGGSAATYVPANDYLAVARKDADVQIGRAASMVKADDTLTAELDKVRQALTAIPAGIDRPAEALTRMRQLGEIQQQAGELYWQGRLATLLEGL